MDAFENGAPPHGGLAFGLDRMCTIIGAPQTDPAVIDPKSKKPKLIGGIPQQLDVETGASIRDYIAFPKTKGGGDRMIKTPCSIATAQLEELKLAVTCEVHDDNDEKGGPAEADSQGG